MSVTVTEILKEIEKLPPSEQNDLRRALDERLPQAQESEMALHDAELRSLANHWDKLGPAPDVDYDQL